MTNKSKNSGFSLVELMIAMAIGLVVIGSVLAFTQSSLTANTEYVQATRLSQELRNNMDVISRDLRRAGYDENVASYTAASSISSLTLSPFSHIFVTNDKNADGTTDDACVLYSYDRDGGAGGTVDLSSGEIRGFRRVVTAVDGINVGVIEMAESSAGVTPSCGGASPDYTKYPVGCASSGWCALSDAKVLNITSFTLDTSKYITQTGSAISTPLVIRELGVGLMGGLRQTQDNVTRGIKSSVKVRADCLEASSVCDDPPTGS